MNDVYTRLGAQVEQPAAGKQGNEVGGREPLELIVLRFVDERVDVGSQVGKIEVSFRPIQSPRGFIISHGRLFSRRKRPQPYPRPLLRLSDLRHPFPPGPLSNSPVLARSVLGPALPSCRAFLPWLQWVSSIVVHCWVGVKKRRQCSVMWK